MEETSDYTVLTLLFLWCTAPCHFWPPTEAFWRIRTARSTKQSQPIKWLSVLKDLILTTKQTSRIPACSCSVFSGRTEETKRSRQCNHIKDSTSYPALAIRLEILLVIANLTSSITQSTQHTIPSALHRPFNFTYSVYLPQPPYYSHQHPRYLPDKVRHPRRMV